MTESKSAALPLGYIPESSFIIISYFFTLDNTCIKNKYFIKKLPQEISPVGDKFYNVIKNDESKIASMHTGQMYLIITL